MRRSGCLLVLVAGSVVGALVMTACSGDDSTSSPASTNASATSATPLEATNWVLTDQDSLGTPLDGVAVSAVFAADQISGSSGCNRYFGPYTVRGSTMTIGPNLGGTQIACVGPADAVERAYLARIVQVTSYAIDGKTLTLSRSGKPLLVYQASVGADALAGGWNATSFYTGHAIESTVASSALTLEFADGRTSGNTGCNTFSGDYKLSGPDGIKIGPLATTRRACIDPAISTQEHQYTAALELATAYQVTGDQLTLFRPAGTIAATFERATGLTSGS